MKRHILENRNEYNYLVKNNLINPNDDYVINDEGVIIVNGVEVGTPASSKPVINGEQGAVHITSNDGEIILSSKYRNESSVRNTNIEIYDSGINLSTDDEVAYTSIDSHNIVIGDGRLPRKSETEMNSDTILIGVGANAGNNIVVDGNFFVNGVQYISPTYVKESMEWSMNPETEELYRRPVVNLENNESNAKVKTDIIYITNINAKYVNDNKDKFVTFLQDSLDWSEANVGHLLNEIPNTSDKTAVQFESIKICDEILANTYKYNRVHNFDWRNGLKIDNKESSAEELIVRYNGSEIATKDDIKTNCGDTENTRYSKFKLTAEEIEIGNTEGNYIVDSYVNIKNHLMIHGKEVHPTYAINEYAECPDNKYSSNTYPVLNFENIGNGTYRTKVYNIYLRNMPYFTENLELYRTFLYRLTRNNQKVQDIINTLNQPGAAYDYNVATLSDLNYVDETLRIYRDYNDESFDWRRGLSITNSYNTSKPLVVQYNGKEIATKEDVQALVDEIDTLKAAIRNLGGNI